MILETVSVAITEVPAKVQCLVPHRKAHSPPKIAESHIDVWPLHFARTKKQYSLLASKEYEF